MTSNQFKPSIESHFEGNTIDNLLIGSLMYRPEATDCVPTANISLLSISSPLIQMWSILAKIKTQWQQ